MTIIMGAESKVSYDYSISNLIMLKMLHDSKVDISGYGFYGVEYGYYSNIGYEFLVQGMRDLGFSVEHASSYSDDPDELKLSKKLEEKLNVSAEWFLVMNNSLVESIILSNLRKEFEIFVDNTIKNAEGMDCDVKVDDDFGIIICFIFDGFYHELLNAMLEIIVETESLYTLLEEEKNGCYLSA